MPYIVNGHDFCSDDPHEEMMVGLVDLIVSGDKSAKSYKLNWSELVHGQFTSTTTTGEPQTHIYIQLSLCVCVCVSAYLFEFLNGYEPQHKENPMTKHEMT